MESGTEQNDSTSKAGGGKGTEPAGSRAGEVLSEIYRLVRRIGRGGMGEIYEAEHVNLKSRSAVKILTRASVESTEVLKRFTREAQIAARLNSENIVRTFDFGRDADGVPYAVMELLDGEDLAQRLKRVGRLTPDQWAPILTQVVSALELAHAEGVVHRDLKPENIFLHRPDSWREEVTTGKEDTRPGFEQPFGVAGRGKAEATDPEFKQPSSVEETTDPEFRQPSGVEETTDPQLKQPFGEGETTAPDVVQPDLTETTLEDAEAATNAEAIRSGWEKPFEGDDAGWTETDPEMVDDGVGGETDDPAATQRLADASKRRPASASFDRAPPHRAEEVAKILDFGISKLRDAMSAITRDRECLGTPQYMSPEQAGEGAAGVDHLTDIFSLGTITYEVLSGRLPFTAPTPMGILYTICHEPAVPLRQAAPFLSPHVCRVVDRALAKRPEDRFQSAEEMALQFADAVQGVGAVDGSVETRAEDEPAGAEESPPPAPVIADSPKAPAIDADASPAPAVATGSPKAPAIAAGGPPSPAVGAGRPPVAVRRAPPPSGARALLTGAMLATTVAVLCVGVYLLLKRSDSAQKGTVSDRSPKAVSRSDAPNAVRDATVSGARERVLLTLANLPPGSFAEVTVNGALHEERPVRLPKGVPCRIRVALPGHEPHVFEVTPAADIIYRLAMVPRAGAPIWSESASSAVRRPPARVVPPRMARRSKRPKATARAPRARATPPPREPPPVRATPPPREPRPSRATPPPRKPRPARATVPPRKPRPAEKPPARPKGMSPGSKLFNP